MDEITRRTTDLTLQIISLLNGEDCTIVKKTSGDRVTPIIHPRVSRRRSRSESLITDAPHSLIPEKKILDLTNEITKLLTGEVPVRCQDAAVYFSMDEWEYMEGQKDQYLDVRMENDPPRIHQDKSNMTARILPLALQIIDLLQGKEQTVVTKTSGDRVTSCMSGGRSKIQSPITEAPHSPTPEKKILQLTNKITELLTGEVPLRCQDVALYFSMEEWDYVEGHRDQYKDVVVEKLRPLVSPENASDRSGGNVMSSLEYNVKDEDILCQSSGENLITPHVHREQVVKYKRNHTREKPYSCSECKKTFSNKDNLICHQRIHTGGKLYSCSKCPKSFTHQSGLFAHEIIHSGEKSHSCSECWKCFKDISLLIKHKRIHTGQRPFSCSECGKCFLSKSYLVTHEKIHKERPYSCSECGKCFIYKSRLVSHERIHIEEKQYSCSVCQKTFTRKSNLVSHEIIHTTMTYSCSECGKCFTENSDLNAHKRIHTGEKSYSCSVCQKSFTRKSSLVSHERIHTRKMYPCSECGKYFNSKALLSDHQRDHNGEYPFTCSECGISFMYESNFLRHKKVHAMENVSSNKSFQVKQRNYAVEKPYPCSECGIFFTSKDKLHSHQKSRTQGGKLFCSLI